MRIRRAGSGEKIQDQPAEEEAQARSQGSQGEGDVLESGDRSGDRRRLLFGDRISGRALALGGVPFLGATGIAAATPIAAGASNNTLIREAPPAMTLSEMLASEGLTLRLPGPGILAAETLSPRQIKAAKRQFERLGWNMSNGNQFNARDRAQIAGFQAAVGIGGLEDPAGQLTPRTLRKLDTTADRVAKRERGYLTQGMKGERVKTLQQRLTRTGDFKGEINGVFDQATVDGVLKFRSRNAKAENGIKSWGRGAESALDKELAGIAHDPERTRVKPSKARSSLDRRATRDAKDGGIGPGSSKEVIKYFQQHLNIAGYHDKANGVWTDHTTAMMHQFQRRSGLPETERAGPNSWRRLQKATIETNSSFAPKMRIGEHSSAVLRLERKANRSGAHLKADGVYTRATERYMDHVRRVFHHDKADGAGKGTDRLLDRLIHRKQIAALNAQIPFFNELDPKLQRAARTALRMGLTVTSTTHGGHAPTSFHFARNNPDGQGHAIDVAGTHNQMVRFFRRFENRGPKELFYDPLGSVKFGVHGGAIGGHGDHVHLAL